MGLMRALDARTEGELGERVMGTRRGRRDAPASFCTPRPPPPSSARVPGRPSPFSPAARALGGEAGATFEPERVWRGLTRTSV